MPEPNTRRTILYALGANAAIGAAKLAAALYTGSNAMFAESVHSFADCGNQALLLLGRYRAKRAATPDYPLGYGKAAYFWSFVVALILFSIGGLFSLYEGWHKLKSPGVLATPWIAVAVLVLSIVIEFFSLRACLEEVAKAQQGRSLWRWFRETRSSDLIIVLGEDLAALLGLALALLAVLAAIATGDPSYDALGSMAVGFLLVVIALGVAQEIAGLLVGQSVEPNLRHEIETLIRDHEGVERAFNIITLQLGADVMVAAKLLIRDCGSAAELIAVINRCEQDLKRRFPSVRWVFFEPDSTD